MKRPCPTSICVCHAPFQTEQDWPVLNLSSEAPDALIFTGTGYTPFDPWRPTPLGQPDLFVAKDCYGVEYSVQSQEMADLLARINAIICQGNGHEFCNDAQTAFLVCPGDGLNRSIFWYTVPACTFVSPVMNSGDGAAWKEASNAAALAYAQQQVSALYSCIESPRMAASKNWACLGEEISAADDFNGFQVSGTNSGGNWNFEVISGELPPGISLVQTSRNGAGLDGSFSSCGTHNYTLRASRADMPNVYVEAEYSLNIFGITNAGDLGTVKVDNDFSYQLDSCGDSGPFTYGFDPTLPPPDWLKVSSTGLLYNDPGDPPDVVGNYVFSVIIADSEGHQCPYPCSLQVTGPKLTCPTGPGVVCIPYVGITPASMSPSGILSATGLPANLSMNAAGAISGTPHTTQGAFTLHGVAADGSTNSRPCSLTIINPNPAAGYTSVQDLVWSVASGSGSSSLSGGGGGIAASGSGGCGIGCVTGLLRMISLLRNCSGAAYNVSISASWACPFIPCGACPGSHSVGGYTVSIEFGAIGSWTVDFPVTEAGSIGPHTFLLPNGFAYHIEIEARCAGPSTMGMGVTITPNTPP